MSKRDRADDVVPGCGFVVGFVSRRLAKRTRNHPIPTSPQAFSSFATPSLRQDSANGHIYSVNGHTDRVNGRVNNANDHVENVNGHVDDVNGRIDNVNGHILKMVCCCRLTLSVCCPCLSFRCAIPRHWRSSWRIAQRAWEC